MHARHLPDDAVLVGHRAARADAVLRAAVDEDLVRIRIAPGVEYFRGRGAHFHALGRADQTAQLRRFDFGRVVALGVLRIAQRLGFQALVPLAHPRRAGEGVAEAVADLEGPAAESLLRI